MRKLLSVLFPLLLLPLLCHSIEMEYSRFKSPAPSADIQLEQIESRNAIFPQKGLTTFHFLVLCPLKTKECCNKAVDLVEDALKKFGAVKRHEIFKEEGFDLMTLLKSDATLGYQINEIESLDGKSLPVLAATL